ncbi:MAG: queuosine precursor transporter [Cryomorphaceae bacterium]|nr:queuosine precursor transporter [Cryomorphaceae bacterium]
MHYLILAALFVSALVTCNLVANKFVEVNMGFKTFSLSAGILAYPVTFLITDVLSEIYGQKRTQKVVWAGFGATVFTLSILAMGGYFGATENSPVSDEMYLSVFRNSFRLIAASMVAYLVAQFIDVRIFHFWKRLTKGKYLWIRNNFSTMFSQLVDTTLVVSVIFLDIKSGKLVSSIGWESYFLLIIDGWLFKVIWAAIDTPVFYLLSYWYKKKFRLSGTQEMDVSI